MPSHPLRVLRLQGRPHGNTVTHKYKKRAALPHSQEDQSASHVVYRPNIYCYLCVWVCLCLCVHSHLSILICLYACVNRTIAFKSTREQSVTERERKRKLFKEIEITRWRGKEKDKGSKGRYWREGEEEIKQLRKADKSLNS